MGPTFRIAVLAAAGCVALAAPAALAKGKPDRAGARHAEEKSGVDIHVSISLGDNERGVVRDYYASQQNCPPGLAKKHNGCLPPGIAKKRYELGRPVFDDAIVIELPHDIIVRLPPLRSGQGYRIVDGDLVVVALATMIVLDAIDII